MKKIIPVSLIFIMTSALLSSCGSLSMTKRHYTKGYYINYTTRTQAKAAQVTERQERHVTVISSRPVAMLPASKSKPYSKDLTPSNTPVLVKKEQSQSHTLSQQVIKASADEKPVTITPLTLQAQVSAPLSEKATNDSDGRGLSLLWLVIVIILILWLIALAAGGLGLGGLLNILLVIALVLLILWLLRIA